MMTWDGSFRSISGLSVLNTRQESPTSLQFSVGCVTEEAIDSGLDGLDNILSVDVFEKFRLEKYSGKHT